MKATLKYIPALLLAATSLWSCEDTLTETPSSGYDKDTYFSSADKANQAILGILQSISTTQNYGNTEIYLSCADDIVYSNRGVTRDNMRDICNYLTEATNTDVENAWLYKYQALDRANTTVAGIEGMAGFAEDKELRALAAEARFWRAFTSFDLIRYWGDVPYTTKPSGDGYESYFRPRVGREEIYDQIFEDLDIACADLPWATAGTSPERATQGAAHAFYMRVLMQRAGYSLQLDGTFSCPSTSTRNSYYAKVIEHWNAIEQNGYHGFYAGGYAKLWQDVSYGILDSKEDFFEIGMYQDTGRRNGSGWGVYNGPVTQQPTGLSTTEALNYMGRAQGFFGVVPEWQDIYEPLDERRDINICTYRYQWQNGQHVKQERNATNGWYIGKWRREWMSPDRWNAYMNYGDVNFCPMRYPDAVLLAAEAYNELGQPDQAWPLINRVRERAGATPVTTANYKSLVTNKWLKKLPVNFLDDAGEQGQVRVVLYFERGLELMGETMRKHDLIRWNVLDKALKMVADNSLVHSATRNYTCADNFRRGSSELMPIPLRELQANHALNSVQNPGY